MRRSLRRILAAGSAAILAVSALGTPAAALYGLGLDSYAALYCSPGLMFVANVRIETIPMAQYHTNYTQLVGWAISIFYSADLTTWTLQPDASPTWHVGWVNDGLGIVFNANWYNFGTNAWEFDVPPKWEMHAKGYYAAMMQVIWSGDSNIPTTTETDPLEAFSLAGGVADGPVPYCTEV